MPAGDAPKQNTSVFSGLATTLMVAASVVLVALNWWGLRFRLRRRVDGWRRGAGLILRGEGATFILSAFGLDTGAQARSSATSFDAPRHVSERLAAFLAGEAELHRRVRRGELEDKSEPCTGPSYTLGFERWVEGPARFVRPDLWTGTDCSAARPQESGGTTDPLLNIICRISDAGAVDIWVRVNHVGTDGAPVQEALSRLESQWGSRETVFFPTPEEFAPYAGPRRCPGRDDAAEAQVFIDFTPLLEWRKRMNESLPEPLTVGAALIWQMAQHPAFADRFIASAVQVRPSRGMGRGVSMLVIRPSKYFSRRNGLANFARVFNRQVYLAHRRRNAGCKALDAAALIPVTLELALLKSAMRRGGRDFGSMGLSILKDAKVFGAPLADIGHDDGFLAIGGMDLPTRDGRRVGCVTIKAPAHKIADYPKRLCEVIEACAEPQPVTAR
ncbi:MAG TPA: hypothetical protein VH370_01590 [Humisphaera sp.]|jgi:hypothetical protein|nr:hypothetical protein [Humisphaera sp.]